MKATTLRNKDRHFVHKNEFFFRFASSRYCNLGSRGCNNRWPEEAQFVWPSVWVCLKSTVCRALTMAISKVELNSAL